MNESSLTFESLFKQSVQRRGDSLAVKDAERELSYRGLDERVTALARELRRRGVSRGDAVVLVAERSVEAVAGILAIGRAGAAFVPASVETPSERLAFILRDVDPRLLLVDDEGQRALEDLEPRFGRLHLEHPLPCGPGGDEELEVRGDDLAYVIYTSGTTGHPKGVMIEHHCLARRFGDWDRVFSLSGGAYRCLQVAKVGFDVFIADVVKALGSGGALVICPDDAVLDPARLYRWLVEERIDYVDIVPAVLRNLVDHLAATGGSLAGMRIINCGADAWTKEEYTLFLGVTGVERLFNGYGVTECTVENALFDGDPAVLAARETLPIGHALGSDRILVVDETLEPVVPGVTGQICIGGPCLARGYLNLPELDREAFFLRREAGASPVRFYKTGDLGRIDEDGVLEFLGRADDQIKIRGHRIELQEIQRVLERFDGVLQAEVCFDRRRSELCAFVRTAGDEPLERDGCSAHLARHLPLPMVPARLERVESFPTTANGKIDRDRLMAERQAPAPGKPPGQRAPRAHHDLHLAEDLAGLAARLRRRDMDPLALVQEFVKPSAELGLLVVGAIPRGEATPTSSLELLALLEDETGLKRRRGDVAGRPVRYRSEGPGYPCRLAVRQGGIEVELDIASVSATERDSGDGEAGLADRLIGGWVLHGDEAIERWRRRLAISSPAPDTADGPAPDDRHFGRAG